MSTQAEQPRVHPRRRPLKTPPPSLSPSASHEPQPSLSCRTNLRLRKGETFHSPTSPPSEECDPVLSIRSLPRRSPTCPNSLEAINAGEQRMVSILGRLNLNSVYSTDSQQDDNDALPVPRGIIQAHIDSKNHSSMDKPHTHPLRDNASPSSPLMDPPAKVHRNHIHTSDSGLGTSVSSGQADSTSNKSKVKAGQISFDCVEPGVSSTQSAITGSISALEPQDSQKRQLGLVACKQIERLILVPILKEERLKPFHPLVQSVPQRIVDKEIGCLRDLEKTLLWLAPHYAASRASYLGFCEFTIQCLHTSIHHLNERDQRLPADRPYTNGYFLDLVAQIRQYAAMINANRASMRARRAAAQPTEEEKADAPQERVTLEGGLSKNGRPAELVVHKEDGQVVSLRTGELYDEKSLPAMKRALSMESLDEGVERSMARRKKNAPPMDINQKCKDCDKVFKRPCDLTKHEKTHSRPWKCSDSTCKYYDVGWPTEKERDRHMNDKHSQAPALFKCSFAPCTYQSKRESNCKQHMEKAHGWTYVRSKNNGRGGGGPKGSSSSSRATPQTPSISTPASRAVDLSTPVTGPSPSPYEPTMGYPQDPPFSFADPPTQTGSEDFQLFPENHNAFENASSGSGFSPFPSFEFEAFQNQLESGDPNGLISMDMNRQSVDASSVPDLMGTTFDNSPNASTDNTSLNFDLDWSHLDNFDEEFTAMNMQLLTPPSMEANGMTTCSRDPSISDPSPLSFQQGKLAMYSPNSCQLDEGVSDLYEHGLPEMKGNDFTLYEHKYEHKYEPHVNLGGGALNVSNGQELQGMRNLNQMFPPLSNQEQLYMNHSWAAQQPMGPEMEMDFF